MSDVSITPPESADSTDAPTGDVTPEQVTPAPAAKLTPAERRDAANAGWSDLISDAPTGDAAHVAALFAAAPSGRELLDAAYNATVTTLATVPENLANLGAILPPIAAHRDAVLAAMPATSARATRPAPVADPAAERLARIAQLVGAEQLIDLFGGAADWYTALANAAELAMADDEPPTDEELDAARAATAPPEKLVAAIAKLAAPPATRGTGTRGTPAPANTSPLGDVGAVFAHVVGDERYTCTVARATCDADGAWSVTYTVRGADGRHVGDATSPTGAALLVNGGGSVNGRAFWKPAA